MIKITVVFFFILLAFCGVIGFVIKLFAQRRLRTTGVGLSPGELFSIIVAFAIFIVIAIFFSDAPLRKLYYYREKIKPMIAACTHDKDVKMCVKLTGIYKNGLNGKCSRSSGGRSYGGSGSSYVNCSYVDRNLGKALKFAELACNAGDADSCMDFKTLGGQNEVAESKDNSTLCREGGLRACDKLIAENQRVPAADLVPESLLTQWCDEGNISACAYLMRDFYLKVLSQDGIGDLHKIMDIMQLAGPHLISGSFKTHTQATAVKKLSEFMQNIGPQMMADPTLLSSGQGAQELRNALLLISMPTLAEGE